MSTYKIEYFPDLITKKLLRLAELIDFDEAGNLTIKHSQRISIQTDKDLVLDSGKTLNPDRPGYFYSIWENTQKNENGDPIMRIIVQDEYGREKIIDAEFNDKGQLKLPSRYKIIDDRT